MSFHCLKMTHWWMHWTLPCSVAMDNAWKTAPFSTWKWWQEEENSRKRMYSASALPRHNTCISHLLREVLFTLLNLMTFHFPLSTALRSWPVAVPRLFQNFLLINRSFFAISDPMPVMLPATYNISCEHACFHQAIFETYYRCCWTKFPPVTWTFRLCGMNDVASFRS